MIRFSLKGPRLATAFLCVALGVPCRTLAQVEAKQQFNVFGKFCRYSSESATLG